MMRALLVSLILLSATTAHAQYLTQSTYDMIASAAQAAKQGYPGRAKELVDRATLAARTPEDWRYIADAYQALGYPGAAREASKKAESLADHLRPR